MRCLNRRIKRAAIIFAFSLIIATLIFFYEKLRGSGVNMTDFAIILVETFIIVAITAIILTFLLITYKRYRK